MIKSLLLLTALLSGLHSALADPAKASHLGSATPKAAEAGSCFPSIGFKMPDSVPTSLDNWWCDPTTEYAFLGFSYEVTACTFPFLYFLSTY